MSLRAILEVVVHLDSFRNIDLFFQGLYYLKVSVHNKKNDEVSLPPNAYNSLFSYSMRTPTAYLPPRCLRRSRRK